MILNETVAAIADAIREKTGKSELIKPVDFASEIKGITAGGGDAPSGGIKLVCLDLSAVGGLSVAMARPSFGPLNALAKVNSTIAPVASMDSTITSPVRAVALPFGMRTFIDKENDITVNEDFLNSTLGEGWQDMQITETEFYDLNA